MPPSLPKGYPHSVWVDSQYHKHIYIYTTKCQTSIKKIKKAYILPSSKFQPSYHKQDSQLGNNCYGRHSMWQTRADNNPTRHKSCWPHRRSSRYCLGSKYNRCHRWLAALQGMVGTERVSEGLCLSWWGTKLAWRFHTFRMEKYPNCVPCGRSLPLPSHFPRSFGRPSSLYLLRCRNQPLQHRGLVWFHILRRKRPIPNRTSQSYICFTSIEYI